MTKYLKMCTQMEMKQEKIAKLFDIVGEYFIPDFQSMAVFIAQCLNKEEIENKTILDVGCGVGGACVFFAQKKAECVVGIDISRNSLNQAEKLKNKYALHNVNFQQENLLKLPFSNNSFDVVFSVGVLPYVNDVYIAFDEIIRVLKKDGLLLLMMLRKTKYDIFYELARRILSKIPLKYSLKSSKILARMLYPFRKIFLGRTIKIHEGKKLEHIILEAFFIPKELKRHNPEEVKKYMENKGIMVNFITVPVLSFCSPKTVFIVKGREVQ